MTVTTDKSSYQPGEAIVCTITGHSEAPNAVTINGVAEAFSGTPTSSSATVVGPAKADFAYNGDHQFTRFAQDLTLTLSFPTEADDSATIQIEPTGSGDFFYTAASPPYPSDSIHEAGTDTGDEVYVEVTSGTMQSISTSGVPVSQTSSLVLERRWFDISLGLWSSVDTITYVSPNVVETYAFGVAQSSGTATAVALVSGVAQGNGSASGYATAKVRQAIWREVSTVSGTWTEEAAI